MIEYSFRIETERLYIRQLLDSDLELLSTLWSEGLLSSLSPASLETLLQSFWSATQEPHLMTGVIFLRDGNVFCGRVNMQSMDQETPELGIDLLRRFQGQGYGSESVSGFLNWYSSAFHQSKIKVRISSRNIRSIHLFEKLGAEFIAERPFLPEVLSEHGTNPSGSLSKLAGDLFLREYLLSL